MQIFKRLSAALKAAGDGPYLRVQIGGSKVYIVGDGGGLDSLDSIELVSGANPKSGSRVIAGHIGLGHLDRLGNGNSAAAAHYEPNPVFHAFPIERRRGLVHRFINPDDERRWNEEREASRQAVSA